MLTALLMIVQQIGAKTTRDTFFLSHHPASELPMVMIGAAVLSLVGALTFSSILQRLGPVRAVPLAYTLHAALFAGEWWFADQQPFITSVVVYLHMGTLGPVVISGFWSLVNEQFDPHTAKKFVSRIAASAAFGGVLGGVAAERVIATLDLTTMLPALALVTLMAGLLTTRVGRPAGPTTSRRTIDPVNSRPGSTRYLRDLAMLVLITSTTAGLLDYAMKAEAALTLKNPSELGSFFAVFHAGVSVVVFLLQTSFSSRSLQKLGIAGTIALLPGAVILGGVLSVAVTRLWTVSLVNAFENVLRSSLYRSGYELLYTPVDKARKRAMKTLIDVGFDRLGDIAAAGLALAALAFLPRDTNQLVVALGVVFAAWGLLLSLRLHRGYVEELAASLRAGTLKVTDVDGIDATTQRTLTDTTMAMDREQLLDEIRALHARRALSDPERVAEEDRSSNLEQQQLVDGARSLLSGDQRETRQFLEQQLRADGFVTGLIPLVIPLLAERALARVALAVLQKHATGREGVLVDALLDMREPELVRRRIPRILRTMATERARDGLLLGLDDPNFGVRYYCAQSLFRLVSQHPRLSPDRERIFTLVAREAAVPRDEWERELAADEGDALATIRPAQHRPAARLEYVFMLLSTILEAEPLELCLKAVVSGDLTLRGTALEYLENVLPARVYASLSKHLLSGAAPNKEKRKPAQIVQELHQSMSNLKFDLDLFRKETAQDER
ncbi:MAG TPA: hypothetical protein VI197_12800 [Polyangiaceae bacterium]